MSDFGKVRAAKLRAKILATLQANPIAHTQADLRAALPVEELGDISEGALYQLLRNMVGNSQLACRKEDHTNFYSLPTQGGAVSTNSAKEAAPVKKPRTATPPAMTVEVVKATGRVRLTLQNIVIEIGVIDQ